MHANALAKHRGEKVHFLDCTAEPTIREFYLEFDKYNAGSLWLYLIFVMTCSVEFCIDMHYGIIQLTSVREVSCIPTDLNFVNWTDEEFRNITYPPLRRACTNYAYNLTLFQNLTFLEVYSITSKQKKPAIRVCGLPLKEKYFSNKQEFLESCDSFRFKRRLDLMTTTGETFGFLCAGIIADLYGRKVAFVLFLVFWFAGMVTVPLFSNFYVVQLLEAVKGYGKSGIDLSSKILFLELCHSSYRTIMVTYLTILGPWGNYIAMYFKTIFNNYMYLTYFVSMPSLMLLFYAWYVPESPLWCLSYCKKKAAWNVVRDLGTRIQHLYFMQPLKYNKGRIFRENMDYVFGTNKFKRLLLLSAFIMAYMLTIMHSKKMYVTLGLLRAPAHRYLIFAAKVMSYMYVLPPILILGHSMALCWFFAVVLLQMILSLYVTEELHYVLSMLIVLTFHPLETVLLLYVSEMLPTSCRAACLGFLYTLANSYIFCHGLFQAVTAVGILTENVMFSVYLLVGSIILFKLPTSNVQRLPDFKLYRENL